MEITQPKESQYFSPIPLHGVYNKNIGSLTAADCSQNILVKKTELLTGKNVLRGIPFTLGKDGTEKNVLLLKENPVELAFSGSLHARHIIVLHSADYKYNETDGDMIFRPMMGNPRLGETVSEYMLQYSDGTVHNIPVRRRFNINEFELNYGELSFECVPHRKPFSFRSNSEETVRDRKSEYYWGRSQFQTVSAEYGGTMHHWLYAIENPYIDKELVAIRLIPKDGTVLIFGITASSLETNPLRWEARKKTRLVLPAGQQLDQFGDYNDIDIDLGMIISVSPVLEYNDSDWENGQNDKLPVAIQKFRNYTIYRTQGRLLLFGEKWGDCDSGKP